MIDGTVHTVLDTVSFQAVSFALLWWYTLAVNAGTFVRYLTQLPYG